MPGVYLFREIVQWSSETGVVVDEASIESSETEEGTDIFEFLWDGPIRDSLEFDRIHSELTGLKMKTKIFNFILLELTFLWFQKEAIGFENVKDLADNATMLFQGSSGNEDVIHVDEDGTS